MRKCFECEEVADHEHHVVPQSRGGTRTVWLCERHHGQVHDLSLVGHRALTRAGMARIRQLGRHTGGDPPYGYHLHAGNLRVNEHEQAVVAEVRRLRAGKLSLRAIAATLAELGHLSRVGKPFQPSSIAAMLRD